MRFEVGYLDNGGISITFLLHQQPRHALAPERWYMYVGILETMTPY